MTLRLLRRAASCAVLALPVAALVACASPGSGPDAAADADAFQLVVRDGSLRELGATCSGARPYLGFHKGAELTLTDAAGEVAYSAVLGDGDAVKVDDIDYGNAPRIPTFCRFALDAADLADGTYRVAIDGDGVAEYVVDGDPAMIFVPALASVAPNPEGSG